jgi:hypothetical protein
MKCCGDGSKAAVAGYGAAVVVGAEAITATVLNAREAPHLSSLVYRLVDPC